LVPNWRSVWISPCRSPGTRPDGDEWLANDPEYQRLLDVLGHDQVALDELAARTGQTAAALSSMLLMLELEGCVEGLPGGRYQRLPGAEKRERRASRGFTRASLTVVEPACFQLYIGRPSPYGRGWTLGTPSHMAKNLLIVESPAKAKTINKYLGKDFQVLASYGHVRDLKPKEGAVDTEHDFAMKYEVIERNEKHVDAIAKAAKLADDIYLATDLDREGEAISWHISEILKERGMTKGKQMHRVVFSEITPKAIKAAVAAPRELSHDMVDAQQARRALDYLVGFNLSPVLWRKVQRGLSAGRVQSPALRMIVEREEEIEAFVAREYWTSKRSSHADGDFSARLTKLNGKKFEQFDLTNEADATAARDALKDAAHGRLTVSEVGSKERKRRPAPPFTTSTLQQEAARKLGFGTSRTMKVAQGLYEGVSLGSEGNVGLITYMRTDSTALSNDAVGRIAPAHCPRFRQQGIAGSGAGLSHQIQERAGSA
jgi:5S rRNA maturation endonuclease (ribonuclease M5)